MRTLYLDIFSGISGDMFLGALIDLGVDPGRLETQLQRLKLPGYHLHVSRGQKSSISGTRFEVHVTGADHDHHDHDHEHAHGPHEHEPHHHHHHHHEVGHAHHAEEPQHEVHGHHSSVEHRHEESRNFLAIKQLISASDLSDWVKQKSIAVFERIAIAEGRIHGVPADQVHFHEVGAIDSIVDIVGAAIALELLGKPRILAAPPIEGTGWIQCAHGRFPVPAPATLAILGARGIALSQCEEPYELITPTGAALLAEFVESFGLLRNLVPEKIGFGLGQRDNRTRPNVLRAVLGETGAETGAHDWEVDTVAQLEANLDDVSAEVLGHFLERALAAGALDVFYTPVQMKKNRPGVMLTILCSENDADRFSELILRETSTFGMRRLIAQRRKLRRESIMVNTVYGEISVKIGRLDGEAIQIAPEFESCKRAAAQAGVPLKRVYEEAIKALK